MVAALITALGAIVVALVALVGPRIEARDARGRLAKDVEVMNKLPTDSHARRVLERHVYHTTLAVEAADRIRAQFRPSMQIALMTLTTMSISAAILVAMGGRRGKPVVEALRSGALPMSYLLTAISVATMALFAWYHYHAFKHVREYLAQRADIEAKASGDPSAEDQAGSVAPQRDNAS